MVVSRSQKVLPVLGVVIASSVLAACGSSSSSSSSSSGQGGSAKADTATASAAIAPYLDHPSAFTVDKPLTKRLPPGTHFAYLQCVTPICGLFAQIYPAAMRTLGVTLDTVKAGASTTSLQSSMGTIIQKKPAALLLPAVEPDSINTQLSQAEQAGIKVSSNGVMNGQRFGIGAAMFGVPTANLVGKLMADWVIAHKGNATNVVFYGTPELSFSAYIKSSFQAEIKKLCPGCPARYTDVQVATIGNTAPSFVVSDLQSHPGTNVAVFATNEAATGLPAGLKAAGITIEWIGFGPSPANLQDIKNGGQTAGLGLDFPVMSWTQVDAAARLVLGLPLTAGEKATVPPLEFLTQKDLNFDLSRGWTGYPDFPARFAKLWSGQG